MLRSACICYHSKREKTQLVCAPKQVTSWVQRKIVNVSRHTNIFGVARHRNDTEEPDLAIALRIVVKFCSLGLEGIFADIVIDFREDVWRVMQYRGLYGLPVN